MNDHVLLIHRILAGLLSAALLCLLQIPARAEGVKPGWTGWLDISQKECMARAQRAIRRIQVPDSPNGLLAHPWEGWVVWARTPVHYMTIACVADDETPNLVSDRARRVLVSVEVSTDNRGNLWTEAMAFRDVLRDCMIRDCPAIAVPPPVAPSPPVVPPEQVGSGDGDDDGFEQCQGYQVSNASGKIYGSSVPKCKNRCDDLVKKGEKCVGFEMIGTKPGSTVGDCLIIATRPGRDTYKPMKDTYSRADISGVYLRGRGNYCPKQGGSSARLSAEFGSHDGSVPSAASAAASGPAAAVAERYEHCWGYQVSSAKDKLYSRPVTWCEKRCNEIRASGGACAGFEVISTTPGSDRGDCLIIAEPPDRGMYKLMKDTYRRGEVSGVYLRGSGNYCPGR